MEYMGKSREKAGHAPSDGGLYRALASGDLPAAWLITKAFTARPEADKTVYATAFNCGLCLYRLEEYEKALVKKKESRGELEFATVQVLVDYVADAGGAAPGQSPRL